MQLDATTAIVCCCRCIFIFIHLEKGIGQRDVMDVPAARCTHTCMHCETTVASPAACVKGRCSSGSGRSWVLNRTSPEQHLLTPHFKGQPAGPGTQCMYYLCSSAPTKPSRPSSHQLPLSPPPLAPPPPVRVVPTVPRSRPQYSHARL